MRFFIFYLILIGSLTLEAQTTVSLLGRAGGSSKFGYSTMENAFYEEFKSIGFRTSFGVEFAHYTSKHLAAITGVEYANAGFNYSFGSSQYSDRSYRYSFVAVPVGYRFYSHRTRFRLYGQLSLMPMVYLHTTAFQRSVGGQQRTEVSRFEGYHEFHLAGSTAFGVELTLADRLVVNLQPTFRVHLTSLVQERGGVHPWTAGLQLSIGRTLGEK